MSHEWNVEVDEPRVMAAVCEVLGHDVGITTMGGVYRGNIIEHRFTTCDLLEIATVLNHVPVLDVGDAYTEAKP